MFANDISAKACATYKANLGSAPVCRDIRKVGKDDYPEVLVDVLTGGFPCVTFSMAGQRKGVTDDVNGKLYLELCRVISEIRPRYFVAENVEGILSANGGAAVKLVLASFLRLGYRTAYQLVNMAEHGVPQTRKRVVFVGVRLDQWRGAFRFPARTRRLHDDKGADKWLPLARTLREAIGDLGPPGEKLNGVMHGDAAAKVGKVNMGAFHNSKPRKASKPSHSQTTDANVLIVDQDIGVSDHAANDEPVSVVYAMSKRIAKRGRRAPTLVSESANVQPFIVPNHEPNGTKAYAFHQALRPASRGRRAPTATTPKQNQPFITDGRDDVAARNPDFFNPLRPAGAPSPTMTSGGQAEVAERSGGMRRMTVRECARVQSFPDWFEFGGSQADGYMLVGNAVPPLYAKRLAEAVLEYDRREVCK